MTKHSSTFLFLFLLIFSNCSKKDAPENVSTVPQTAKPDLPKNFSILPGEIIFNHLPKRVAFGTQSEPQFLNQTTSINGDYLYTYLTGDPMNGTGWETWNTSGTYASNYINSVTNAGKIPVLTYYVMVTIKEYTDPPTAKFTDAVVMKAYFENWLLLMKKCGETNKQVIVHYEPDMSAYMQQAVIASGNNPASIPAKVKTCGFTDSNVDVNSFEDNAKGIFQLIKALRDKYAPNVTLAYQLTQWATGQDLIPNHAEPIATAQKTIEFYKNLNTEFDMFFSEFSDRDFEWYKKYEGKDRYWNDDAFETFRKFLKECFTSTGKRIMLWQIPAGNRLYKACNNTDKHYQDNRPEFFFEEVNNGKNDRLASYAEAGVIGYLFGHGAPTCTAPYDEDNIVNNPSPINGNNRDAIENSKDDDGGYIRYSLKKYYDTNSKLIIGFQ